jgi:hypothetical protein
MQAHTQRRARATKKANALEVVESSACDSGIGALLANASCRRPLGADRVYARSDKSTFTAMPVGRKRPPTKIKVAHRNVWRTKHKIRCEEQSIAKNTKKSKGRKESKCTQGDDPSAGGSNLGASPALDNYCLLMLM